MRLPTNFKEWQDYANRVHELAARIYKMRADRGWAIARDEAGIGRCMCSLHNCSIATIGKGWGHNPGGRERIKAARRALRLIDDYTMNRIADRVVSRAWEHYRAVEDAAAA
jgi:hypothetical protein